jgi:hypothetical protein
MELEDKIACYLADTETRSLMYVKDYLNCYFYCVDVLFMTIYMKYINSCFHFSVFSQSLMYSTTDVSKLPKPFNDIHA